MVTVSKDKIDALKAAVDDRNLFSHSGLTITTFGITLGLDNVYSFILDPADSVSLALAVTGGAFLLLGLAALYLARTRGEKVTKVEKDLFDSSRLIADFSKYTTDSGVVVKIDHLSS